jgi:hypothetical protein
VGSTEVIRELERRFLLPLRVVATVINALFPNVRAAAWSQGQVIALTCFFPVAPTDQPDEVSLQIVINDVQGPKSSLEVDVIWGYPGQVEEDLFNGSVPLSEHATGQIEAELPRLVEVLLTAVRRGRPLN